MASKIADILDTPDLTACFPVARRAKASVAGLFKRYLHLCDIALSTHNKDWQSYLDDFHFRHERDIYKYAPRCYHYGEVDKPAGGIREISRLEDKDLFLAQQALNYVFGWIRPFLHIHSYGGIPNKSPLEAIQQFVGYVEEGNEYLVKFDIKDCYPTIDWKFLKEQLLALGCLTPKLVNWLLKWVGAPVYKADSDTLEYPKRGLHTGCPLSNLLLNIFLTPLDQYCQSLGLKFVRYYDDILIACKTEEDAKKAFKKVKHFIEQQFRLTVHPKKSKVRSIFNTRLLGFTLWKRRKGVFIAPNIHNVERFKGENITGLVDKLKRDKNICAYRYKLNEKLLGFANSYQIINSRFRLMDLDRWVLDTTLLTISSVFPTRHDRLKAFKVILKNKNLAQQLASKKPHHVKLFLEENDSTKFGTKLIATYATVTSRKS